MSQVTLNRIRSVLEQQFAGKIDMSDYANRPAEDTRKAFLQRALAALCVKQMAGVDIDVAALAVTDGYHDGGLDAIYFDPKTDTLFWFRPNGATAEPSPSTLKEPTRLRLAFVICFRIASLFSTTRSGKKKRK